MAVSPEAPRPTFKIAKIMDRGEAEQILRTSRSSRNHDSSPIALPETVSVNKDTQYKNNLPDLLKPELQMEVFPASFHDGSAKLNKNTKIWVDEDGAEWATRTFLRDKFGIASAKTLERYLEGVSSRLGKSSQNQGITLYKVIEIAEKVSGYILLPTTNKDTGRYRGEDNRQYVNPTRVAKEHGMNTRILIKHAKKNGVPHIKGRGPNGQKADLYDEEELLKVVQIIPRSGALDESARKLRGQRGHWTDSRIEKESLAIYDTYGYFSTELLKKLKKNALLRAVKKYSGKMPGLKKKLGIPPGHKTRKTENVGNFEQRQLVSQLHLYQDRLKAGDKISFEDFLKELESAPI